MLRRIRLPASRSARARWTPHACFMRSESTTSHPGRIGLRPALAVGVAGGLAGGTTVFLVGYAWYYFSGARKLVNTAKEAKAYLAQTKQRITQKTPESNEAHSWLKDTMKGHVSFVPGARGYVDLVFDDLEQIRCDHGEEFDKIVCDAYRELRDLTADEGVNAISTSKALLILRTNSKRLFDLVREGVSSGRPEDVEKYVKIKVHQAKGSEVNRWNKWTFGIPGGSKVIPQLQSLHATAQKKGSEMERMQKDNPVEDGVSRKRDDIGELTERKPEMK